jgi:diguanylate cyclase (GGDEF)-like protein
MRRYSNPLSCVMIDIDHFKRVNDSYGHEAGDEVLKSVARRLTENLRTVDVAARYGGEEFAVLLPHTPKQGAAVVAERMRELLHQDTYRFAGHEVVVTASFGISDQTDAEDAGEEALLRAADEALYEAKKAGRDRVVLAGA